MSVSSLQIAHSIVSLENVKGECRLDLYCLRRRAVSGFCEHGQEYRGSIRGGKFLG
jgi:hypothetical protein